MGRRVVEVELGGKSWLLVHLQEELGEYCIATDEKLYGFRSSDLRRVCCGSLIETICTSFLKN
jgi:hypothetical protein